MVRTDLHDASARGDAAKVERLLKQHPEWVHEKDGVRSARVGWAAACGGGCGGAGVLRWRRRALAPLLALCSARAPRDGLGLRGGSAACGRVRCGPGLGAPRERAAADPGARLAEGRGGRGGE